MLIVARESRSQEQNRRNAEQKLLDLVRRALVAAPQASRHQTDAGIAGTAPGLQGAPQTEQAPARPDTFRRLNEELP